MAEPETEFAALVEAERARVSPTLAPETAARLAGVTFTLDARMRRVSWQHAPLYPHGSEYGACLVLHSDMCRQLPALAAYLVADAAAWCARARCPRPSPPHLMQH